MNLAVLADRSVGSLEAKLMAHSLRRIALPYELTGS